MKKIFVLMLIVLAHLTAIYLLVRPEPYPADMPDPVAADIPKPVAADIPKPVAETGESIPDETTERKNENRPATKPDPRRSTRTRHTARPAALSPVKISPPANCKIENCKTGILVDWSKRKILWGKKENQPVPIASLTKIMTVLLLMEKIEEGNDVSMNTMIPVSKTAASIGGRQVWLDPRESFTIKELLKCVMIRSANDCAFLLAEFLGKGNENTFVNEMNTRAKKLGFRYFKFHNSHGLPPEPPLPENTGCVKELALLAGKLLEYPEVVRLSSTRLAMIREKSNIAKPFQLVNTNKLVGTCPGVNGMKTGYTKKSGHCLVATCERGGRIFIAAVTGCSSSTIRNELVESLLEWGYSQAAS